MRNLPLFLSLFPLEILLTAGPKFFMGASLSFILFGSIATSGIVGN